MAEELELWKTRADNNRRPPDWRWRVAQIINNSPGQGESRFVGLERMDPLIKTVRDLQTMHTDVKTPIRAILARFEHDHPVAEAYELWAGSHSAIARADIADVNLKEYQRTPVVELLELARLDGLILARTRPQIIADIYAVSVDGVRMYEEIFFDVRDRLRAVSWVASNVIGTLYQAGPITILPRLIRAYGYYLRSRRVVNEVASVFNAPEMRKIARENPDQVYYKGCLATQAMKADMAIKAKVVDKMTHDSILEQHREALESAAKIGLTQKTGAEQQLLEAIGIVSGKTIWGYGNAPTNYENLRSLPPPELITAPKLHEPEAVG